MATFTGQLISATYDAIIKTIDNDAIGSTAKQLTDGLGNVTPLYVSNTQIGIGITPTEALDVSGNIKASLSVIATTFSGDLNGTINTATTGVTQTVGNDTTKIATTAFVQESHVGKPTGSGTGGKIALWSGSGSSTVLTDSSITEESTQYLLTKDIRIFDTIPAITLQDSDSTGSASLGDIQWLDNAASQRAIISLNNAVLGIMSKHGGLTLGTNSTTALTIDASQNSTFAGLIQSADGSAAAPTYSFSSDTDTGIYKAAANTIGFSTAGSNVVTMTSQYVGIGNVATNPLTWLHVKGNHQGVVTITQEDNSFTDDTYSLYIDNALQTANKDNSGAFAIDVEAGRAFTVTGNGKIGINKTRPTSFLDVAGTGAFTGQVTAPTFIGDLNGTINTLTTATTQSANNNSTKVATTAYADAAASAVPVGDYLPLAGGTLTGALTGTSATFAGIITANSSSSGDYVRMYGSSGTGKWDIYGNGANLRISDNESAGILAVDTGATFAGDVLIQQAASTGLVVERTGATGSFIGLKDSSSSVFIGNINQEFVVQTPGSSYSSKLIISSSGNSTFAGKVITTQVEGSSSLRCNSTAGNLFLDSTSDIILRTTSSNTTALTIDTSQNATFAGDVYIDSTLPRIEMQRSGSTVSYYANASGTDSIVVGSVVGDQTFRVINKSFLFSVNNGASAALKIDSSGNVGIGTDSPSAKVDILGLDLNIGADNGAPTTRTNSTVKVGAITSPHYTTAEENFTGMLLVGNTSVNEVAIGGGTSTYNSATQIKFYTGANSTTVLGTERMRISSDGNIFMDSPKGSGENLNLVISDTTTGYAAGTGGSILFQGIFNSSNNLGGAAAIQASKTNSTDGDYSYDLDFYTRKFGSAIEKRMTITSGGYVHAGNTAVGNTYHEFAQKTTNAQWTLITRNTTALPYGLLLKYDTAPNNSDQYPLYFSDSVAAKFYMTSNGAVYNNGTYGTISDRKLKENIEDATPKLDDINKLKVRNFNFKNKPEEKHIGFIAQEFEEVFPKAVETKQDRDSDGKIIEDSYTKTIKTSILIPMLVKAIQELKAEVEMLEKNCNCK